MARLTLVSICCSFHPPRTLSARLFVYTMLQALRHIYYAYTFPPSAVLPVKKLVKATEGIISFRIHDWKFRLRVFRAGVIVLVCDGNVAFLPVRINGFILYMRRPQSRWTFRVHELEILEERFKWRKVRLVKNQKIHWKG